MIRTVKSLTPDNTHEPPKLLTFVKTHIVMSIIEMKVPSVGESITEVTLSQWLKPDGAYVELDEPICEFESDKATLEFPAEAAGKLIYVASEGDDLEIGALVAKIDTSVSAETGEASVTAETPTAPTTMPDVASPQAGTDSYAAGHPSPSAAKLMREAGIDASAVTGTGKDGRITKPDVEKAAQVPAVSNAPQSEPATTPETSSPNQAQAFSRETTRKKMSRMRRTIARRLVSAKNSTAMLTTFNEVDLTQVMAMRKTYQDDFMAKYGIKLGFMSLFAKACATALMDMPDVNAILDGDDLIYHDYADISIAISTPNGLVVPPIHNVESLHFADVEKRIKALADKARQGTLTLEEMQGGTFTITNGGVFGSLLSTPIINEPQSAILGMHSIQQRPIAVNGEVKIRPMMYVALSYDHRVIDGSTSVTFLVKVKQLLEDPLKMLLEI